MEAASGLLWVAGSGTPLKTYITRVLNLGTWKEWRTLRQTVPPDRIFDAIEHPLRGQWTPRGKAFAECMFDRVLPDDVLISYV